jgi:hypothetical protein
LPLLISTLTPKLLADFDLRMPRTMPTFREDPAAYMRDYRARKRELAAACDKAAGIKGGGVVTTVNGRLDAMTKEAFEARRRASPAAQHSPPAAQHSPSPAKSGAHFPRPAAALPRPAAAYIPTAPKSMFAVGGRPGTEPAIRGYDPTFAPHEAWAVQRLANVATFEANATASINLLAREVASLKREVAELKQAKSDGFVAVFKGLTLLFG